MSSLSVVFDLVARDKASKELSKVGDAADGTGKKFGRMSTAVTAAATAMAAAAGKFAFDSIKSASSAEQAFGGVETVFGRAAATVERYAADSAKNLGLAGQDYATLAATVGSQLQRMGQSQAESAVLTDKLITLGADLAATYGGSVADAVSAVGSLLRGERDPIERYGVGINDAAIKAKLLEQGLGGLTGAALEQAKGQATLTLLTEQTTKAQGAAGRESGTLQGQTIRLSAQYKDLTAQVGAKLLPVITSGIERFGTLTKFLEQNRTVTIPLAVAVGGLTAAVLAVNAATKASSAVTAAASTVRAFFTTTTVASTGAERASTVSRIAGTAATVASRVATIAVTAVTKAYTVAQLALNLALRANPIGLVITALAALAAGVKVAYDRSDTFRGIVQGLWGQIKTAWEWLGKFTGALASFRLPGWVSTLGGILGNVGSGLKSAFGALRAGVGDGPGRPVGGGGSTLNRVKALLPAGAYITSTYRTPAENARVGGSPRSYHMDRANPAVDIGGPTSVLNEVARRLRAQGGWRELLWKTKGHFDHVHVAHAGGTVDASWPTLPGLRSNERPVITQTGETILAAGDSGRLVGLLEELVDSNRRLEARVAGLPRASQMILRQGQ